MIIENLEAFIFDEARKLSKEKNIDILEALKLVKENYRPQVYDECLTQALEDNDLERYAIIQRICYHPDEAVREHSLKELQALCEERDAQVEALEKEEMIIEEDNGRRREEQKDKDDNSIATMEETAPD
jgi:Proteasome non-ATPase 26S subunit